MKLKVKLMYITAIALFFGGLSLYLLTTPDLEEVGFFVLAARSVGILISTSIAVGFVLKLILGKSLERDIIENVRMEIEKLLSGMAIKKYCIRQIIAKRTEMPSLEVILNSILEHHKGVEVFISGVSLSAVFPFYNDLILKKISDDNFRFRFLLMDPKAQVAHCFGLEVGESDTFEEQLHTQYGHIQRLLKQLSHNTKNLEVRTYDTIPFNSIAYYKTADDIERMYFVVYLNSVPGANCPVLELRRSDLLDTTLFDKLLYCYEQLWSKATPVKPE